MASADWTFRAVTAETWPDMATLFAGKGGPKSCWCMMWRKTATGDATPRASEDRHLAMKSLVQSGQPVGILGYAQGIPVAWCSIAPRATFGGGLGPTSDTLGIWSLTCFYICASHRGQGGFAALLRAAETHAFNNGAAMMEAYPVEPDSPSYRFSGFAPNFLREGYAAMGTIGARRQVMRKGLR